MPLRTTTCGCSSVDISCAVQYNAGIRIASIFCFNELMQNRFAPTVRFNWRKPKNDASTTHVLHVGLVRRAIQPPNRVNSKRTIRIYPVLTVLKDVDEALL